MQPIATSLSTTTRPVFDQLIPTTPVAGFLDDLVEPSRASRNDRLCCPISGLRLSNPVLLVPIGSGGSRSSVAYDPRSLEFARAAGLTCDPIHNRPLTVDNTVPAHDLRALVTASGETTASDAEVQTLAEAFAADWLSNDPLRHGRAELRLKPWRNIVLNWELMLQSYSLIASLRRGDVGAAPQLTQVRNQALTYRTLGQLLTETHRPWLARRAMEVVATWHNCLPPVQRQWPMGDIIPVSMPRVLKLLKIMGTAARALETTSETAVSFMINAYIKHNMRQDMDSQSPFYLVAGQALYQLHQQQMLSGEAEFPYIKRLPNGGRFLPWNSPLRWSGGAYDGDLAPMEC